MSEFGSQMLAGGNHEARPAKVLPRRPTMQTGPGPVDCPAPEAIPLDDAEGLPLQILSLNLGISGIKGSLGELSHLLFRGDIAAVHLQEARLRKRDVIKWRKNLHSRLPKYAMYVHCYHGNKNTAVVTLLRKELVKWTSPMALNSASAALSGRIIALRYTPPNIAKPLVLANIWMPHSGYSAEAVQRAHTAFGDLMNTWKSSGHEVLAAGDWNATVTDDQRSVVPCNPVPDQAFRQMLVKTGLKPMTVSTEPTWTSSSGRTFATLDHILFTNAGTAASVVMQHEVTSSDHQALLCTLKEDVGCWNVGQHVPVVRQDRLNLSDLDNLVPLFCSTIDAHQDKCTDLESLERQMWNTAQEVLGLQKQAGGKPFLNKAVAALRKAIKVARRLLRFYSHAPHTKATHAATWQELGQRLTTANASAQAAIFFGDPDPHWPTMTRTTLKSALKQCVYDLRETIRTEIRAMEKACLAANIAKSRLHLETGKRGVQRAMGKGVADARMSEVVTTHPSVVIIPLDGLNEEAVRVQCSVTVENVALDTVISADGSRTLRCTPPRLQDVSALLLALESTGILADLERRELTVEDPDDIISALEHFMGMEGKARGMLCRMCSSPEMTCLSRLAPEGRTLCWYCPSCRRCREYVEDLSLYDKVPWPRECVTGYPRVPGGDIPDAYRLRKPIRWEDFLKHLHCMANRKAPGDDMVVAELWKNAPEWAKQLLFAEINAVLMGKPMPDHWRGGTVQFLFKKPPASSLPNWRPICLLNVSYRLYSSIITDRLSRMVEAYGILDQVQEAFSLQRGTRRQIETLLNIIRSAKIQNRSLVIALLDFRNAFNSNDVAACMRILKEYNIPDLDLIDDMYQGAYYQARTSTGSFTARIPLTRRTKQGDPLSPLIFNLTVNMLVRMLKQSGHSFQCLLNTDGLHLRRQLRSTARLFADDTAMVAHSVHSSNALMTSPQAVPHARMHP